jgi:hypothetical protein
MQRSLTARLAPLALLAAAATAGCGNQSPAANPGGYAPMIAPAAGAHANSARGTAQFSFEDARAPLAALPDGTRLHSIEINGATLRAGMYFKADGRYVSQREYLTPLGLLIVNQTRATVAPRTQTQRSAARGIDRAGFGIVDAVTTKSGTRFVVASLGRRAWVAQATIGGTVMSARIPAGTPLSAIHALIGSVK